MKIELTKKEIEDLYDMLYMMDAGVIKINNCQKSWNLIFNKIEPIVVPELHKKEIKGGKVNEILPHPKGWSI